MRKWFIASALLFHSGTESWTTCQEGRLDNCWAHAELASYPRIWLVLCIIKRPLCLECICQWLAIEVLKENAYLPKARHWVNKWIVSILLNGWNMSVARWLKLLLLFNGLGSTLRPHFAFDDRLKLRVASPWSTPCSCSLKARSN